MYLLATGRLRFYEPPTMIQGPRNVPESLSKLGCSVNVCGATMCGIQGALNDNANLGLESIVFSALGTSVDTRASLMSAGVDSLAIVMLV